jgi:hypothetical protein
MACTQFGGNQVTAYTSAAPFEFEGAFAYRPEGSGLYVSDAPGVKTATYIHEWQTRIVHTFIEAERDTWAWEVEGERARKGRFTVELRSGVWIGHHDDFPDVWWDAKSAGGKTTNAHQVRNMLREFNQWKSTQTPPLPAVPNVGDYIRAVTADGREHMIDVVQCPNPIMSDVAWIAPYPGPSGGYFTLVLSGRTLDDNKGTRKRQVVSWSPANRPTPAWHTPEPGSLWKLTVDGHTGEWVALAGTVGVLFRRVHEYGWIALTDPRITAGREVTR